MSNGKEVSVPELHGALTAPIILFDEAPVFGVGGGMGRITLSAIVQDEDGKGGQVTGRVVVAHLRGNAHAFVALREAINGMELMVNGPATSEGPAN